jgi:hypothetical protein
MYLIFRPKCLGFDGKINGCRNECSDNPSKYITIQDGIAILQKKKRNGHATQYLNQDKMR